MDIIKTGHGPTAFVAAPGGPGLTADSLADLTQLLPADKFTCYAYSPWLGRPVAEATLAKMAAELAEVVDTVQEDRVVLFGHSFGVAIVLQAAQDGLLPAGVVGMVLANGVANFKDFNQGISERLASLPTEEQEQLTKAAADHQLGPGFLEVLGRIWFPKFTVRAPMTEHMQAALSKYNLSLTQHFLGSNYFDMGSEYIDQVNYLPVLAKLEVPVLTISSEHDYAPQHAAEQMASVAPAGRTVHVADAGHFAYHDQPEAFGRALLAFLG